MYQFIPKLASRCGIAAVLAAASLQADAGAVDNVERAAQPAFRVEASPIPGWYEALFDSRIVYLSADGRYALVGELIDVARRENLTEDRWRRERARLVATAATDAIVYRPGNAEPRHALTVFTDVDCPFCRRFHADIDRLLQLGFEIRYLLYVSADDEPGIRKARSILCSAEPARALDVASRDEPLPERACAGALRKHLDLAERIGVRITPTIVTERGRVILGYTGYEWLVDSVERNEPLDLVRYGLESLDRLMDEHLMDGVSEAGTR